MVSLSYLITVIPLLIIGRFFLSIESLPFFAKSLLPLLIIMPLYYLITLIPGTNRKIKKRYGTPLLGLIIVIFLLIGN